MIGSRCGGSWHGGHSRPKVQWYQVILEGGIVCVDQVDEMRLASLEVGMVVGSHFGAAGDSVLI